MTLISKACLTEPTRSNPRPFICPLGWPVHHYIGVDYKNHNGFTRTTSLGREDVYIKAARDGARLKAGRVSYSLGCIPPVLELALKSWLPCFSSSPLLVHLKVAGDDLNA